VNIGKTTNCNMSGRGRGGGGHKQKSGAQKRKEKRKNEDMRSKMAKMDAYIVRPSVELANVGEQPEQANVVVGAHEQPASPPSSPFHT